MNFQDAIVLIGGFTIWVTPIAFVLSLLSAIEAIHKDQPYDKAALVCVISLVMTLVPIMTGIASIIVGRVF